MRDILKKGHEKGIGPGGENRWSEVFSSEEIGSQESLDCVRPLDFPPSASPFIGHFPFFHILFPYLIADDIRYEYPSDYLFLVFQQT